LVDGTRAYELARQGKSVVLASRSVVIYSIELQRYTYPELDVEIRCGKGTYVRSIARDLGESLGTGAYVKALRRTRIGSFTLADATPWEAAPQVALHPCLKAVSGLVQTTLNDDEIRRICLGQSITWKAREEGFGSQAALLDSMKELIGLGEYDPFHQRLRPIKVFRKP
jgi:tRNA pseudouridine55 synthase